MKEQKMKMKKFRFTARQLLLFDPLNYIQIKLQTNKCTKTNYTKEMGLIQIN